MSIETNLRSSYDAIVVGARCAGAATAMLLARQGLQVLAIDRGRHGTDTLSTHALMRAGVLQLHRWGILDDLITAGTPAVRTTSFHYGDDVVEIEIKPRGGVDALYAPRRTVIDRLLVDAARKSGAEVVHQVRLVELLRSADNRVSGVVMRGADGRVHEVGAGLVVGADGMRSTVADLVSAETHRVGAHATAVIFSYWSGVGLSGYHWYYRPGTSVGAIETNDGLTCIFVAIPPKRFRDEIRFDISAGYHKGLMECDPGLADAVASANRVEKFRGFSGHVGFMRKSWGPGWMLVGDAGYFKDPLTAHGITDALIDAELLARAVAQGGDSALSAYQDARDDHATKLFEVTDAVASFEWNLPDLQKLHRSLSDEMKRETAMVTELGVPAPPSPPDLRR